MSQLVEDSHMAAATALCAMPNSPMPKKLLRGAGNGVHPSPLGSSPFSLFTASLSPMYFGSQSRDGAGSLAASPLPRQTPTLTARLTPGMYTLDPDSNSISGLMSSPLVNNASNASFASYTSRGRNPSFLQRLKFDEESSIPFMPDTPQHSNASTTPGGRSRIRICNGEISKFKIAVINYDDEAARDATITNSTAMANSNDPLSFLGQQAVKSENGELNDAINTMAHDFMMEQGSTSGKFKATTMGKLTGKRAGSGPSHLANSTLSDTVLPAAQRLRDTCDGDDASSLSARSKGKYKRKREGDVTDHLHDLQSSAKKSNQGVPNPGDDPVTPANQRLMRAGRDITSVSLAPSTPSEQKRNKCNCKKSKCLKLYCECFAAGLYCDGCNCNNCANNKLHEEQRESAVKSTLDRNPNAFRPKIKATPLGKDEAAAGGVHYKGCHCKKSYCLKKYCECFQAGVHCGDRCKCSNCKNFEGSTALAEVSSSSVKRSNKQNNMITPAKSTTMNARNISSLPRGSLSKANVKSFTNLTPSSQTNSGKLPRATGANSTPSLQMNRQHNTALNMTPQGHGGRYTQQQTPQSILRSGSTIKQNKLEGFPLATKPVVGISTTKQSQTPSVSPPRNNRRPNQGATTAHVITKNKEYEEDVQAFGTKNVKLDKRLVVSILTYLDNSDLYQTSLVSKTLGPIAISDSLWEFPTEAEPALGDAVAQP